MIAASGSPANCRASSVGRHVAGLQPAFRGHAAVAGVDPQHQPAGKLAGTCGGTSRAGGWPACRSPAASVPGRAVRESSPRCECRRPVRTPRRPTRRSRGRGRFHRLALPGAVQIDQVQAIGPQRRPNAAPWRPDRRQKPSPAGSRPAGDGRICPLAGRSPARSSTLILALVSQRSGKRMPKHVI